MSIIFELKERLEEFYIPISNIKGIIQINISGNPDLDHFYTFSEKIDFSKGSYENFDTRIFIPLEILDIIIKKPGIFEPRDPMYSQHIKVEGNVGLMHYFTQLLKRPDANTQKTIENIRLKQYPIITEVKEVEYATPYMILDAAVNSYPLHIVKALKWDFINWSPRELEEKIGKNKLRKNVLTGKDEYFSDFMQAFRNDDTKRIYTNGIALPQELSEFFTFPYLDNFYFYPPQIWLGKNRENKTITKLHCDFVISFLGQIWGTKKIYLYSPDQYKYLYPISSFNNYQPCLVDPADPDHETYPLFKNAKPLEVIVNPGDLLIIPAGWYHCVWAIGNTFSVSRMLKHEIAQELYKNPESI